MFNRLSSGKDWNTAFITASEDEWIIIIESFLIFSRMDGSDRSKCLCNEFLLRNYDRKNSNSNEIAFHFSALENNLQ
jgi:hypothetical protein